MPKSYRSTFTETAVAEIWSGLSEAHQTTITALAEHHRLDLVAFFDFWLRPNGNGHGNGHGPGPEHDAFYAADRQRRALIRAAKDTALRRAFDELEALEALKVPDADAITSDAPPEPSVPVVRVVTDAVALQQPAERAPWADAANDQIDAMLHRLWERRPDKRLGLSRDDEVMKQWQPALAEQRLTSTWRAVRARYDHPCNRHLRGKQGVKRARR